MCSKPLRRRLIHGDKYYPYLCQDCCRSSDKAQRFFNNMSFFLLILPAINTDYNNFYLYRNVNKTKFILNVTGVVAWWLWAAIGKIRHGKSYKSWQYSSQIFELEKQNLPKSFLNVLNIPFTFSMLTHSYFVRAVRWLWYPKQHSLFSNWP